jgi:predicted GNAT family N-acyltransferase
MNSRPRIRRNPSRTWVKSSHDEQPESVPEIRPACGYVEYEAALTVRRAVFVDEQGGPLCDEPDAWDTAARHFIVVAEGVVVGAARLYVPEEGTGKLGRICLLREVRSRGWGRGLLAELLKYASKLGLREVILDAQSSACPFYERFGFQAEGEEFIEAGIPHQRMRLALRPAGPGRSREGSSTEGTPG